MGEQFKPQEEETKERSLEVWDKLAEAFGGYSQVPMRVVGMALAGQINNNSLEFKSKELDGVVDQICKRWEDQDFNPDEIRQEIVGGMKEMTKDWTEDEGNKAVAAVRAIDVKE